MPATAQYQIRGGSAWEIVLDVEAAVERGDLASGQRLPPVRRLAAALDLSPATVAAAYRTLGTRGVVVGRERSATRVSARPPLGSRAPEPAPRGTVDLAGGNPDPALLPDLAAALARLAAPVRLYGEPAALPSLLRLARDDFAADGIPGEALAVTSGALDGIERALAATLRPGDAVIVEDPCYTGVLDLVRAMGLTPRPVPVDEYGLVPDRLAAALDGTARAVVFSPRAANPSGAALTPQRAAQLRDVLEPRDSILVVEDDHAGAVAGAPHVPVAPSSRRWVVVRSVSKALGPDLRLAVLAGDETTVSRVEGRLRLGAGWVSSLLQQLVVALWSDSGVRAGLATAAAAYADRRTALRESLAGYGIAAAGRSGLNVWVPVAEEHPVVQGLAERGWAVRAGEPFRVRCGPAVRITTAALPVADAPRLAEDVAAVLHPGGGRTRSA